MATPVNMHDTENSIEHGNRHANGDVSTHTTEHETHEEHPKQDWGEIDTVAWAWIYIIFA